MRNLLAIGATVVWCFANYSAVEYGLKHLQMTKPAILAVLLAVNLALYLGIRAFQKQKAS